MMLKFTVIATLLLFFDPAICLHEDQIGKFDWMQRYIGAVDHMTYSTTAPTRKVIVSTKQNVLAALSLKNGEIVWRHVLEDTDVGHIDYLSVEESTVTVVTGNMIRTWDSVTAALKDEILLDYGFTNQAGGLLKRVIQENDNELVIGELLKGSLEIITFDLGTGAKLDHFTISAPWLQQTSRCNNAGPILVCVEPSVGLIFLTSLVDGNGKDFESTSLTAIGMEEELLGEDRGELVDILTVPGSLEYLVIKIGKVKKLVHVHESGLHLDQDVSANEAVSIDEGILYTLSQDVGKVTILTRDIESGSNLPDHDLVVELPPQSGQVEQMVVHRFTRKDGGLAIRALVTCTDHSMHYISQAGVVWSRQESLSSVLTAESVDLPVAGAEVNYQDQISLRSGLVGSLMHRIKTQWNQISGWTMSWIRTAVDDRTTPILLTRDQFNLHKLIILVTSSGKLFALDNWNGDIIWTTFIPNMAPLSGGKFQLYTQRTVAHFPHEPQCVVVGKDKVTGNGLLYVFLPTTGIGLGGDDGIVELDYKLSVVSLLHQSDEHHLKPLMLIDSSENVHLYPSSGESVLLENKESIYVHLASSDSANMRGFSLKMSTPGNLVLLPVWSVILGNGVITGVYPKLASEKVHSPGRVLADRSVLYKYVNPNLVVVTTITYDHINKNTLTLHLLDTVTGSVIESVVHKRVSGPIHIAHSENWVVYTSFSDKSRRYEVTTLEMFEGLSQSNATAFSSLGGYATPPLVERLAFILPQGVQAVAHTTTEKSITAKYLLFGLQSGSVLQMSKWFLDPRRPITQAGPREEGLIPYMPELPLHPQEMITYNRTLPRIHDIFTAPTGLESTCIVLVYGLDLFYTRVFPSKMFDMLKDDFDHYLISGALFIFVSAAVITRKFAQRKALNQAWK